MSDSEQLSVRADLDVPGETRRQMNVFVVWALCLALAVVLAIRFRPKVPTALRGTDQQEIIVSESRKRRALIVLALGLAIPISLTWWLTHRRRRGGPHARAIVIDITSDHELRLWGHGYGQRLRLHGADVSERLIDVYTGRMGAWRQRRMTVRAARAIAGQPGALDLATPALPEDMALALRVVGGEGDCIELTRDDYLAVLARVRELSQSSDR